MKKLLFLAQTSLLAILIIAIAGQPALAVTTTNDLQAIGSDMPYYDPGVVDSCTITTTPLSGSENAEKTWNFFIGKGLTPIQAAAIMGNLKAESGINPRRVQGTPTPGGDSDVMKLDGTTGFGIAQWTAPGRQKALHDAALAASRQDSDMGVQLDYLWTELNGGYKKSTLDPLKQSTDVRDATKIVLDNFEAPKERAQNLINRTKFANDFITLYGSGLTTTSISTSATPATTGCGTDGSTGQVVGNFSLPLDKTWYDKYPERFTKPHHDYPAADIPIPSGTPVYSMTAGKVLKAPVGGDCGRGVMIDAGSGVRFLYCHGEDGGTVSGARTGDTVTPGQLIMHSDNTGASTGPHLHVQINVGNVKHCPQQLFVAIASGSTTVPQPSSLPTSGCTN